MIKKHRTPEICDHCGTNTYEYCSIKNAIGRSIYICRKCAIRTGMIEQSEQEILNELNLLTPKAIVEKLNERVIGQDATKKSISVEIYSHLLRLKGKDKLKTIGKKIRKNNILLCGPSGSGKTLLAETISEMLNIPMVIFTVSQLTEHGYSGMDIESILSALLAKCDGNIKLAEKSIVFLDEIDKIAKRDLGDLSKDVNASGIQKSLLRMLESDICSVPPNGSGRLHPDQKMIQIDTSNILFLCGGAFSGIEEIVERRLKQSDKGSNSTTIGFGSNKSKRKEYKIEELRANITVSDLKEYGMMQEFIGRFGVISNLHPLSLSDMIEIIKLPGGILDEFKAYFELQGKTLTIQNSALEHIAKIAIANGTGGRGIRNILKSLLEDYMFTAPTDETTKYIITQKTVENFYKSSLEETA